MDAVSILAIVSSSLGLALKCGKVAKDIHGLASRWKQAELSALELVNDCRMLETALKRIELMTKSADSRLDEDVVQQLQSSLELGAMVISALEEDLETVIRVQQGPAFRKKSKIMWNEGIISNHQGRVTRQLTAMTCLLKLMELPSLSTQRETLAEKVEIFRKAESSAWTIVNSRASTSMRDDDSTMTAESKELEYRRLSFENLLFTTTVYKRSFRTKAMAQFFKKERASRSQRKPINFAGPLIADDESAITSFQSVALGDTTSILGFGRGDVTGDARASSNHQPPTHFSDPSQELLATGQTKLDNLLTDIMEKYRPDPMSTRDGSVSTIDLIQALKLLGVGIRPSNNTLSRLVSIKKCALFDLLEWRKGSPLVNAIHYGSIDAKSAADISDTILNWRNEFLIKACNESDLELFEELLKKKINVNCRLSSGLSYPGGFRPIHSAFNLAMPGPIGDTQYLLHFAAIWDMLDIVSLLLEKGAAPDAKDAEGDQPLHLACRKGHLDIVKCLHKAGASLTTPGKDGLQPLHALVTAEYLKEQTINPLVDFLVKNGADVNAVATESMLTPLQMACDCGRLRVAKHLLFAGAKPDRAWFWASPSFMEVAQNKKLHAARTRIFAQDEETLSTPLHKVVAQFQNTPAERMSARLLISWGVDIQAQDRKGRTALHIAAMRPEANSLLKLLVDKGSEINAVDHEDMSALHIATKEKVSVNMKLLANLGANVRIKNRQGRQAIHTLIENWIDTGDHDQPTHGSIDDLDLLIRHGAVINATDFLGHTPISIAISKSNAATVNALVSRGAVSIPIRERTKSSKALKNQIISRERTSLRNSLNDALAP